MKIKTIKAYKDKYSKVSYKPTDKKFDREVTKERGEYLISLGFAKEYVDHLEIKTNLEEDLAPVAEETKADEFETKEEVPATEETEAETKVELKK